MTDDLSAELLASVRKAGSLSTPAPEEVEMASIYDKPVRELMHDAADALGATREQPITRTAVVNWFNENYPDIKKGTISAHLLRMSTNAHSRVHYSVKDNGSDDLLYQLDSQRFRRYDPANDPAPIYTDESPADVEDAEESSASAEDSEFAYEHDLRNYLSKNMGIVELGLTLYEEDEGIRGIEFPVGGRFIDLLGVDKDGSLVVIELKVSRGYDRVIGQLLRYIGWIESNMADEGQKVRGIIIAKEISEDLKLACLRLPEIELKEYELAVTVRDALPLGEANS